MNLLARLVNERLQRPGCFAQTELIQKAEETVGLMGSAGADDVAARAGRAAKRPDGAGLAAFGSDVLSSDRIEEIASGERVTWEPVGVVWSIVGNEPFARIEITRRRDGDLSQAKTATSRLVGARGRRQPADLLVEPAHAHLPKRASPDLGKLPHA